MIYIHYSYYVYSTAKVKNINKYYSKHKKKVPSHREYLISREFSFQIKWFKFGLNWFKSHPNTFQKPQNQAISYLMDFIVGNSRTSRIAGLSVRSMTRRSMP